jgi:5-methylcytosine-specific restriction enzyme A
MPKLRSLPSLVRQADTRTTRPPPYEPKPKLKDSFYNSPGFRSWRAKVVTRAGNRCEAMDAYGNRCPRAAPQHLMFADHVIEIKDGGAWLDLNNGQCLCRSHHAFKTHAARKDRGGVQK